MTDERKNSGERLGKCERTFKPTTGNIVAGFIISVLLVLGGLAIMGFPLRDANRAGWNLPFYADKNLSWVTLVLACVMGALIAAGGIALALFARFLLSHRLDVCANGLRYFTRGAAVEILWSDVSLVRETVTYERLPLLKGPAKRLLPKVASNSYTVIVNGSKEYRFTGNTVEGIKLLGLILKRYAGQHSVPWESVEVGK